MKPSGFLLALTVLLATTGPVAGGAERTFERKLSKEHQAIHVLNRLAFGPRPGQVEEVRRRGVHTWMREQLDPRRVPENPTLDARLQASPSLQLASWQILEQYQNAGGATILAVRLQQLAQGLSPQVVLVPQNSPEMVELRAMVTAASLDDRRRILLSLAPDTRRQLLVVLPTNVLQGLPDLQREAAEARQAGAQPRMMISVRPLAQLLPQDQVQVIQRGSEAERTALLKELDEQRRQDVLRAMPAQTVPSLFRREHLRLTQPQQLVTAELVEGKLLRAVYSTRQLEEVLVDFWLNHFNVFTGKDRVRFLVTSYERDAIRPHVLGRFGDMLRATARHPAMLLYLDNWQSQAPREEAIPGTAASRGRGLNENYGRELLELHTLGVDGGYTQDDVIAVARAFTGWTIHEPGRYGEFFFNPAMHDRGEKIVLGHTLPAGGAGEQDGLRVLEILERHPSTARFIARKLAQRFVADDPPATLVARMADTFTRTGGDLRAVMETLLFSSEFMSEGAWRAKTKSPLELVVSAVRALDADVAETSALAQRIAEQGQPLYGKQEPTGYPNTGDVWASSASLLARMNFANALATGAIPGVSLDLTPLERLDARQVAHRLLGTKPPDRLITAIRHDSHERLPTAVLAGVLLASPDFQTR